MKTDARKLTPETREAIRHKAVAAVENGMTRVAVAALFGLTRQSVERWVQAFRREGPHTLARHKRGPKTECSRLKGWQAATIADLIRDRDFERLKLPFVLWTRKAAHMLI